MSIQIRAMAAAALVLALVTIPATTAEATSGHPVIAVPQDYPSIQAAVNAAAPGTTITVGAGRYTEELVVNKDVNLRGAGVGASVIVAPTALTAYGVHLPDGRQLTAIVRVGAGAHVRMSGFTVRGPIPCGIEVSGINVVQGATLDLTDSRVTGIRANPATCASTQAAGRAIVYGLPPHIVAFGADGSTAYGRVTDVMVDHFQHAGISVTGPETGRLSNVTIAHDVVIGGWTIPSFQYGIDIESGTSARVTDSVITGAVCGGPPCGPDPINQGQGVGVILLSLLGTVRVWHNVFAGNDVGIYQVVSPDCCAITSNVLLGNRYFGIVVQDGNGVSHDNVIHGGQVGIAAVADFIDTTLVSRGDSISGTRTARFQELDCCGVAATVVVKGG